MKYFEGALRLMARGTLIVLMPVVMAGCGPSRTDAGEDPSTDTGPALPAPDLEPTFESPDALARAIVEGLNLEKGEELKSYALNKEQFRYYVWPELPVSRPEVGMPFDYLWDDTYQKSHNSLLRTFDRYKGRAMELLELKFEDGTTDYETYVVHRDTRVKVRFEDGSEEWLDLFGSVMEYEGRFKLFSYVTD